MTGAGGGERTAGKIPNLFLFPWEELGGPRCATSIFCWESRDDRTKRKGGERRQGVLRDHTVACTTHTRTQRLTGPRRAVR